MFCVRDKYKQFGSVVEGSGSDGAGGISHVGCHLGHTCALSHSGPLTDCDEEVPQIGKESCYNELLTDISCVLVDADTCRCSSVTEESSGQKEGQH